MLIKVVDIPLGRLCTQSKTGLKYLVTIYDSGILSGHNYNYSDTF